MTPLSRINFSFLVFSILGAQAQEGNYRQLDFSLLRQYDVIVLPKGDTNGFYKNLKQIQLGHTTTLHFGGSYRLQSEAFINEEFSAEVDQDDSWFLNRFQFHAHFKWAERFEFFAEMNSSLIWSKQNLAPVDKDELGVNQLYARYRFDAHWDVLVGRQNMRLGSGRLIDVREGPNVRLSFDMVQLHYRAENTALTTFYAVPVRVAQGIFDNEGLDFQESVGALYWTQHWRENTSTDIYMIYKTEEAKTWDSGTADDHRLSLGLRHFGNWNKWRYNNEFVFQTGSFGEQDIRAWTVSLNLEHPIVLHGYSGALGFKTEAISGDTGNADGRLNTFDGLYPRGAYFGRVARIGPSNLFDIHPYFDISLGRFALEVDYVAFWRLSRQDGVYGPPLNLQYASVNEERFIGHQVGSIASFGVNRFIDLELEANVIFPGSFLVESGLDNTLFHMVFTAQFRF
ncbi:MAG: alginate export family protein [Bacteroidota bacterium]